MARPSASFTIGQVAQRTGLSVHTLRFYEKEGLFATEVRRIRGNRVYGEKDLDWLHLCTRLRASGMPLTAIREYAALVKEGPTTLPARLALLHTHQQRIVSQIEELSSCSALIARKVALYEEQLAVGGDDPLLPSESRPGTTPASPPS
ncbi:DNA-binding transcriptional MerR regulator [Nocardia tenerifensis]|uniref:DNA-binding transcriptional MerR regulator n=1 Tax=Nocardia tenerifensis TaxID=228006 RepID=A0A318K9N4_9NOCA|nr:MerR family transcriptional regulator [Nocardia tenerifensis]PXX70786.1 DNA-binding transcriptional MerR regulator [Nocardia tenerifensis]